MKKKLFALFAGAICVAAIWAGCCNCRNNRCLIISDIHLNPFYTSDGSFKVDDQLVRLLLQNPDPQKWESILQKHMAADPYKNLAGNDSDYGLLKSEIDSMYARIPNPAFIVIAGDFLWHGNHKDTSSLLAKLKPDSLVILKKATMNFIAYLFKGKFKNVPIIPVLGNNDTNGSDYEQQNQDFLNAFSAFWQLNGPTVNIDSLSTHGYYTYSPATSPGLEFVSLNTTLVSPYQNRFDTHGKDYNKVYTGEGLQMLSWLQKKLESAPGKIWIISHIPPGIDEYNLEKLQAGQKSYTGFNWEDTCNRRMGKLLEKYGGKVKFYIAGHTHFNEYRVLYDDDQKTPFAYVRVVPSLGTNHIYNPSFEIANFDNNYNVLAETEYYMDLGSSSRQWRELNVDDKLKNATPESIYDVLSPFDNKNPPDVPAYYLNFYNVGKPVAIGTGYLRADIMHVKGE